jgi:hypothetical protein
MNNTSSPLREVIFKVYTRLPDSPHHGWLPLTGYFHGWGYDTIESTDGNVSMSVAIIEEKNTGEVHLANPSHVTFLKPYNEQASTETLHCGPISLPEIANGRPRNPTDF